MKLSTPNGSLPYLRVVCKLANDATVTLISGGTSTVEVDDTTVEALLESYDPQGNSSKQAWVKDLGYMSIDAYLERQKREEELKGLREERKERIREKNAAAAKDKAPAPKG